MSLPRARPSVTLIKDMAWLQQDAHAAFHLSSELGIMSHPRLSLYKIPIESVVKRDES